MFALAKMLPLGLSFGIALAAIAAELKAMLKAGGAIVPALTP